MSGAFGIHRSILLLSGILEPTWPRAEGDISAGRFKGLSLISTPHIQAKPIISRVTHDATGQVENAFEDV